MTLVTATQRSTMSIRKTLSVLLGVMTLAACSSGGSESPARELLADDTAVPPITGGTAETADAFPSPVDLVPPGLLQGGPIYEIAEYFPDDPRRVVLMDFNDPSCERSISSALALYGGTQYQRLLYSVPNADMRIQWPGISTSVSFQSGRDFEGCTIVYLAGGPGQGIPAIELPAP